MKFLVISGDHEVTVARSEEDVAQAQQGNTYDRVVRLDAEPPSKSNVVPFSRPDTDLTAQVEALEERLITEVMASTGNNQVKAAAKLKITRGALQYKLKKFAGKLQQAA